MIAAYCRVSSTSQNTEAQEDALKKWLVGNDHDLNDVKWYIDQCTGTKIVRPAFSKLQQDIFMGEINTVICWKIDRLSRNVRDGVNILTDWAEREVRCVVVAQSLDINSETSRFVSNLLLSVAQLENSYRRERQQLGIERAKEQGVYSGRKQGSYKTSPDRINDLLNEKGLRPKEVAAFLGVSLATVYRHRRQH